MMRRMSKHLGYVLVAIACLDPGAAQAQQPFNEMVVVESNSSKYKVGDVLPFRPSIELEPGERVKVLLRPGCQTKTFLKPGPRLETGGSRPGPQEPDGLAC